MVRDEELWYEVVMEKGRRRVVGGLLKYTALESSLRFRASDESEGCAGNQLQAVNWNLWVNLESSESFYWLWDV